MKNQYRGGNCLKKGRVGKKEVSGVFERGGGGWYPNAHYEQSGKNKKCISFKGACIMSLFAIFKTV